MHNLNVYRSIVKLNATLFAGGMTSKLFFGSLDKLITMCYILSIGRWLRLSSIETCNANTLFCTMLEAQGQFHGI